MGEPWASVEIVPCGKKSVNGQTASERFDMASLDTPLKGGDAPTLEGEDRVLGKLLEVAGQVVKSSNGGWRELFRIQRDLPQLVFDTIEPTVGMQFIIAQPGDPIAMMLGQGEELPWLSIGLAGKVGSMGMSVDDGACRQRDTGKVADGGE